MLSNSRRGGGRAPEVTRPKREEPRVLQIQVTVEHRADIPGGMPAIWTVEPYADGCCGRVRLYLLSGLPTEIADKFRAMCVRACMPDHDFDVFTITSCASEVREVLPRQREAYMSELGNVV